MGADRADLGFALAAVSAAAVLFPLIVYTLVRRFVKESPLASQEVPLSLQLGFAAIPGASVVGFFCGLAFLRPYRDSLGLPCFFLSSATAD